MPRRVIVLTLATVAALVASAGPAFTTTAPDSGTVVGTVTALGGGACLELTNATVSFGSLPFSTRSQLSSASGITTPTFKNCGNLNESISISGSDASGVNTSWQLGNKPTTNPCFDATGATEINVYALFFNAPPVGRVQITKISTPISTYGAGVTTPLALQLYMPCVASSGAGQTASFSIDLTAVVA